MTFPSVHPALGRALGARGYSTPTAVQLAVLEADTGRDLLVSAQTGSGKTVAFGMAIAPKLLGDPQAKAGVDAGRLTSLNDAVGLERLNLQKIGEDFLLEGYPKYPKSKNVHRNR